MSSSSKPLASVSMFDKEDINDGSLLEEAIRTYVSKDIYAVYGLNLTEFLELPMDVIQMLFNISNERDTKKAQDLSEIEKKLK